jgi:hypothetical protein
MTTVTGTDVTTVIRTSVITVTVSVSVVATLPMMPGVTGATSAGARIGAYLGRMILETGVVAAA